MHWFLLNAEAHDEVDWTAADALELLRASLAERGVIFAMARVKQELRDRARRKGLVRNACITAGNYADEKSLPELIRVLETDPSEVARGASAWAIGRMGGPAAKRALTLSLQQEQDDRVLGEIQEALLQIESGEPFG